MVVILVFLLVLVCIFIYESKQQKRLAQKFAYETITKKIQDRTCCENESLSSDIVMEFSKPIDTDLFELTWSMWFKAKPSGYFHMKVSASKGIAFFPLFNSEADLIAGEIEYHPDLP